MDDQIHNLEDSIRERELEINNNKERILELVHRTRKIEREFFVRKDQEGEIRDQIDILKQQINNTDDENVKIEHTELIKDLTKELEKMEKIYEKLETKFNKYNKDINKLQSNNKGLKVQNEHATDSLIELRSIRYKFMEKLNEEKMQNLQVRFIRRLARSNSSPRTIKENVRRLSTVKEADIESKNSTE